LIVYRHFERVSSWLFGEIRQSPPLRPLYINDLKGGIHPHKSKIDQYEQHLYGSIDDGIYFLHEQKSLTCRQLTPQHKPAQLAEE
jgi:hypothetical protein